jgi:acetyltransferase
VRGRDLAGDVIRDGPAPRREPLLEVLARAFDEDRDVLAEDEAKAFLDAYGVPVSTTRPAWSADEAVQRAREVGTPVVLKVRSPAITHKSDAGAVVLDLDSERSVREAYDEIARNVEDEIGGPLAVTVQPMVGPVDHELLLGAVKDDVFGPALMFGRGGTGVEIIGDTAMALPPLDPELARRLMRKTRIHGLLEGYRGTSAADLDALGRVLVGVSWMVIDFPQIGELDVNPLAISDGGPIALDARVILDTDVAPDAGPMDHALAGGH